MKRLVYNPRVDVYIKGDTGIYDLSPYVVSCSVDRKLNQVSTAQVAFRNPDFMFTEAKQADGDIGPVFHPMDPIVIAMTRLVDKPIQVFTGYCDGTPYFQLFPGVAAIDASCTLKRLMYTYWDPGLPFVWEYLIQHNWQPNSQLAGISSIPREDKDFLSTKLSDDTKLKDPGLGQLLFDVLHDIGGWEWPNIYIEKIPPKLIDLIGNLFDEFKGDSQQSAAEFQNLMHELLGGNTIGGAISGGTGGSTGGGNQFANPPPGSKVSPEQVGQAMLDAGFPAKAQILANGMETMEGESGFGSVPGWDSEHDGGVLGYWQIQRSTHPGVSASCCMDLQCSTNQALGIWKGAGGCFACQPGPNPWQGGTDHSTKYLKTAERVLAAANRSGTRGNSRHRHPGAN